MTGIPKPGEVDAANIWSPDVQQLPAEIQKILDDIQKKEEAMNQYITSPSIDKGRSLRMPPSMLHNLR